MNSGMTLVELIEVEAKKQKNLAKKNIHQSLQLSNPSFAEFSLDQLAKDHIAQKNFAERHQIIKSSQINASSPSISDSHISSTQTKYQPREFSFTFVNDLLTTDRNSKSLRINHTRLAKEYRHKKNSEAIISYIAKNSDASAAAATASRFILKFSKFLCFKINLFYKNVQKFLD